MISAEQVNLAKAVDLISLVGNYTTLRRASGNKELMGPCPKCGGDDRLHVKTAGFFCRQCKRMEDNHDIWYDQIDFVRWMDGCDFLTAVEKLTGTKPMTITKEPVKPTLRAKYDPRPHYTGWFEKAEDIIAQSREALMQVGNAGAAYLDSRGITPNAWTAYRLGYAPAVALPDTWDGKQHTQPKQPAIVIPWYRGGNLTGIRYRFLDTHIYTNLEGEECKTKSTAMHNSSFTGVLYGGQALMGCAEQFRTLVICEGELNAISIWQVAHLWNFDVLSLGSESSKLTQPMIDYANKFERVLIWMDKPDMVKQSMAVIGGAYGISSPVIDGEKQDANRMLQTGILGGCLVNVRHQACRNDTERLRLLWNIQDAIAAGHLDLGACDVAVEIANKLGINL